MHHSSNTTHSSKENLLHTLMYSSKEFSFLAEKHLEKSLQEHKLPITLSQVVVLLSIESKKEAHFSQCNIAEFLHVTEATISRHIKTLITQGFLQKNERVDTKRSKDIIITKAGKEHLDRSIEVIHEDVKTILSPLSDIEKNELHTLFKKLITPLTQ